MKKRTPTHRPTTFALAAFATLATLGGVAVLASAGCGLAMSSADRPNVILITIDTLRADRLSCYGYFRPTSPAIDRLAEESVLFENVYAPMSTTLPVHLSLMTSTHPMRHGVQGNFEHFGKQFVASEQLRTMAQMFEKLGYATGGFVSAAPVKAHSGLQTGFNEWWEPGWKEAPAEAATDEALKWIAATKDRPFFLWIHYYDPHEPFKPPPPYDETFKAGSEGIRWMLDRKFEGVGRKLLRMNDLYDGEIRYVDSQIEKIVNDLETAGLYDEAAMILTADHGEGLGQHNWRNHGRIYNEQLRVPLIMKFPESLGVIPARRVDLASILDVLPSLAGVLGLDLAEEERAQFEGLNLFDDTPGRETVFSQRVNRDRQWEPGRKFALTGLEWKYFMLTEGDDELFHLAEDPHESVNVIADHPDVAAAMKDELLREMAKYEPYAAQGGEKTELPDSVVKELEALGYVQ